MSSSDQELEYLDAILKALPQENYPMTVSELDGYVTGVLCCPVVIPPSDWLPHVWGETGDASFPHLEAAQATVSAVMGHYDAVASDLTRSPWIEPIYEVDPNSDEVLWEPWIDGFTRAMGLRPETWQGLLERADDETRSSLIFLLALKDINEGTSKLTEAEIDEVDLEAPDLIPNLVAEILMAARPELIVNAKSNSSPPPRTSTNRPGRNDPCPCGSGRKYRQCCGKN